MIKVTLYRSPVTMELETSIKGLDENEIFRLAGALTELARERGETLNLDFLNVICRTQRFPKIDF